MTSILLDILGPILLMVAAGALLRWKFRIDVGTLSKINIYFLLPAFIFDKVARSELDWARMGGLVGMTAVHTFLLGLIVWALGRAMRIPARTLAAVAMAVMFYNSGNYGLPLAELAFGSRGGAAQAFVVLTQNVLTFTVGLAIATSAQGGGFLHGLRTLMGLPVIPTLLAALAAKWWLGAAPGRQLPHIIGSTTAFISAGLVPIALATLGAQLASSPRWPRWRAVGIVVVLRLVLAPLQMLGLLWALHWLSRTFWPGIDLWPWPGQLLVLTAAVPTAVNTLLLTLEVQGDADLAADCVFWTTIFSVVTLVGWLALLRGGWLG